MGKEDFKNLFTNLLFNSFAREYPFKLLEWQIETLIPKSPNSQKNVYK
ncbi:hypothetical protein ACXYFN_02985 [Mycoplasma sp. 48589B]